MPMNGYANRLGSGFLFFNTLIFIVSPGGAQGSPKGGGRSGVARSGMEHGEAMISVRSDVRLSIRGTGGTTSKRLAALGEAMRSGMPHLKMCYGKLVSQDPAAAVGKYRITVSFTEKSSEPRLEFPQAAKGSAGLKKCILSSLGKTSLKRPDRPAAAVVTLDFTNTRASGQKLVDERSEPTKSVKVEKAENGALRASWKTEDGKLGFVVTTDESGSKEAVAVVLSGLRRGFGTFLDCRRRAGKRGTDPAGETVTDLRLMRKAKVKAKNRSSTLKLDHAASCVERAYRRLDFKGAPAPSRVTVRVVFAK